MSKNALLILIPVLIAINSACGTAETTNTNSNANKNIVVTNTNNLPSEFSASPVAPSGNTTPGIPDPANINITNAPKGATPTPGIPDPATIGKTPLPKGATPTPGIPDAKTLKQQTKNAPLSSVNPAADSDSSSNGNVRPVRKP